MQLVSTVLVMDEGKAAEYGPVERLRTSQAPFMKALRDSLVMETLTKQNE